MSVGIFLQTTLLPFFHNNKPMNNRRSILKYALTVLTIIIIVLSIIMLIKGTYRPQQDNSKATNTSINTLISNELCQFDGCDGLDRSIELFMRKWELKGASFAVMRNDSLLYAKGYGFANLEDSIKCDAGNLMRMASVSKLITAVAIMKLCENNRLSLNSQVFGSEGLINDSLFLNIRSSNLEKITVEHLLRHTAGFSSPIGDPAFNIDAVARTIEKELPLTLDDMVLYATRSRLRTIPSTNYDYSNLGYIVLGKVIEKVTKMPYELYVQDSILHPIGVYDMYIGYNFEENRRSNESKYYEVKEAEPVEAYNGSGRFVMKSRGGNDVNLLGGAGGWIASSAEILRVIASINNNPYKAEILNHQSIETMTYDDDKKKPIGWSKVTNGEWQRSGSMAGTCAFIKSEKNGLTWAFISNSSTWRGPRISTSINYSISTAIKRVKEWPKRDLFNME